MKWTFIVALVLSCLVGMLVTAIFYEIPFASASPEQLSPTDRVSEDQVLIFPDYILINIKNAKWASFADTNSMDPLIDKGANALQVIPQTPTEIQVGDVISYQHEGDRIIHRVVYIGEDEQGWYCIVKGDNNKVSDPGKVRFDKIDRVLFGVLY